MEAARHWLGDDKPQPNARPQQVDAGMVAALRAAGASEAEIERLIAERGAPPEKAEPEGSDGSDEGDEAFGVEPDNWESWQVFMAVQTRWDWVGGGFGVEPVRVSLKTESIESALRLMRVKRKRWAQVFDDLRVIELAVLGAEQERRERRARGKGR